MQNKCGIVAFVVYLWREGGRQGERERERRTERKKGKKEGRKEGRKKEVFLKGTPRGIIGEVRSNFFPVVLKQSGGGNRSKQQSVRTMKPAHANPPRNKSAIGTPMGNSFSESMIRSD